MNLLSEELRSRLESHLGPLVDRVLRGCNESGVGAAGAAAGYLQFGYYSQGFLPQMAVTALLFGASIGRWRMV